MPVCTRQSWRNLAMAVRAGLSPKLLSPALPFVPHTPQASMPASIPFPCTAPEMRWSEVSPGICTLHTPAPLWARSLQTSV